MKITNANFFIAVTLVFVFQNLVFTEKTNAQTDTVSLLSGYTQQVWYNLQTCTKYTSSTTNWDLAFDARSREASIFINPNNNLHLYLTKTAPANWATVDTVGIFNAEQFNADTSWYQGAFNRTGDGYFNYGWGNYNQATHNLTANNIYVMKLADGTLKKFIVDKLSYDTTYTFRQANLDGTNEQKFSLNKTKFAGKLFGYFSLSANALVDREPKLSDWDLTFVRYNGLAPDPASGVLQNYLVVGALLNQDVTVAKVVGKDTAKSNYTSVPFAAKLNTIGYDWKSFDMTTNKYKVADSTTYFVKRADGKIVKLIFKGFGGSANGNIILSKQTLTALSAVEIDNGNSVRLSVQPNPTSGNQVQLVVDVDNALNNVGVKIFSVTGAEISFQKVNLSQGLQVLNHDISNLTNGFYFAQLQLGNKVLTEKFVVNR